MAAHWGQYDPSRWGWRSGDAAEIVPFEFGGHLFPGGVAVGTVALWTRALTVLTKGAGFRLPDIAGDGAGCWGYEDRTVRGSDSPSFHAYGLALDLAAPWNPSGVTPPAGPYRMPSDSATLLWPLGIEWGGSWSSRDLDWMHIECHLGPDDVYASMPAGPPYPLPAGYYYGPYSGPTESISGSGRADAPYRPGLAMAQRHLKVAADGYYGAVTAAATVRWQTDHGLTPDGLIGPATWASLVAGPVQS